MNKKKVVKVTMAIAGGALLGYFGRRTLCLVIGHEDQFLRDGKVLKVRCERCGRISKGFEI
jgi:hypothetical protein